MANKLYEESNIQAIANAIRGKNGSSDTYTVAQMASAITNIPDTMPTISNGRIETLYAMDTTNYAVSIPANSFVELDSYGQLGAKFYSSGNYYTKLITTNKFITCSYMYNSNNGAYFNLIVESISNHTITSGNAITIQLGSSNRSNYDFFKFFIVSQTKGFIVHKYDGTSIKCIPININDYTITYEEPYEIVNDSHNSYVLGCDMIDTNKFMITYRKGTVTYIYARIFEYNNGNYTVGSEVQINSSSNTSNYMYVVCVDTNKAIILHSGSSNALYGTGVTISGYAITAGTMTKINSSSNSASNVCYIKHTSDTILLGTLSTSTSMSFKFVTLNNDNSITSTSTYSPGNANFFQKPAICQISSDLYFASGYDSQKRLAYFLIKINSGQSIRFYSPSVSPYYPGTGAFCSIPITIDTNKILLVSSDTINMFKSSAGLGFLELESVELTNNYRIDMCIKRVIIPTTKFFNTSSGERKIDGIALDNITSTTPGRVYIFNS